MSRRCLLQVICGLLRLLFCCFLFLEAVPQAWAADSGEVGQAPAATAPIVVDEAPVIMWGRTIVVFRKQYLDFSPAKRAKFAQERLSQIPSNLPVYHVVAVDAVEDGQRGAWLRVNGRNTFGMIEGEEDVTSGETFDQYKQQAVKAVEAWLYARKAQYEIPLLLRSFGFSLLAIFVAVILFFLERRLNDFLLSFIRRYASEPGHTFTVAGVDVAPYLFALANGLVKILEVFVLVAGGFLLLTFIFALFPYTQPWARELSGYLIGMLQDFGHESLQAIPGLFTVAVIYFLTRLLVSIVTAFFRAVEQNSVRVRWFEPETAKATRSIVVVLIWIFALIIAYPLIPGSETKAFQGVSVFLGLMLSLGSAGLVGQLVGGIVAVYTKSFRAGDYVRIGEHEGIVKELGVLAAKIVTIRNEEITIPNVLLMSSTTINFSRQAGIEGAVVTTFVTIGYDAPWRQVHAMLEIAAGKTKGIRHSPKPFVLQKALSDFYIEYTLMFRVDRPEERYFIMSELHGHIQDVFNEYGVQIMSPNFVMQPEKSVVVPREEWFAEPSRGQESGQNMPVR